MKLASLAAIAARFTIRGGVRSIEPHGAGHINRTWRVTTDTGARYVLQRINEQVFRDAAGVVCNTAAVTTHVRARDANLVPACIPTQTGSAAVENAEGVFRMLAYVEGRTGSAPPPLADATAAGLAFGRLQALLTDYDASQHVVPIVGFLDMATYRAAFDATLEHGDAARRDVAGPEIARIVAAVEVDSHGAVGPQGMIHGDGKIDNVLFHADCSATVIDLDTVMWGRRAWDFGDLVRSAAAHGAEDAPGLTLDLRRFRALAEGFVHGLGGLCDGDLRAALLDAPAHLALMLGTRFLTDFLSGDRYFKVADETHNLRRARAQLSLYDSMTSHHAAMAEFLRSI